MRFDNFNRANVIGGSLFATMGVVAAGLAMTYPVGHINRMGPGYLPLVIGVLLTVLGVGIMFQGRGMRNEFPAIQIRALLTISAAMVGFGLVAGRFGLVPATFVVIILSPIADQKFRPVAAVLTAAGLSIFAYLVFIKGLGVSMHAFAWG